MGIQYVIPALLCYYGRKEIATFADNATNPHRYPIPPASRAPSAPFSSIFGRTLWIVLICIWAIVSGLVG